MDETSSIATAMRRKVRKRESMTWIEVQEFLDVFERETATKDETCKVTFQLMEGILMTALTGTKATTRKELKDRSLAAPSIDRLVEALDAGLSSVHTEIFDL